MASVSISKVISLALLCVLSGGVCRLEAAPPKLPYRSKWVTVVKKGKIFKYKRKEYAAPKSFEDKVFVGADSGYFYAMSKKNGKKIWRFRAAGPVNSAPAFQGAAEDGRVFFGDDKGVLYALTAQGKELWRTELGSEIVTAPAVSGDRIFVATLEGRVAALSADAGKVLWDKPRSSEPFKMTVRGNATPVVDEGGGRLFVGFADGTLAAFSTNDGRVLWEKSFAQARRGFNDIDGAPLIDGDRLYVSVFDAGEEGGVFAVSKASGQTLWQQKIGSGDRITSDGSTLYVAGTDGQVYALQKKDGAKLWSTKLENEAMTLPVLYRDVLAVGLSGSTVNFLNAQDGRVLAKRHAKKGVFSDPFLDPDSGQLYYFSNGGRLYALSFIEKK